MAAQSRRRNRSEDEQIERAYRSASSRRKNKKKSKKAAGGGNIVVICLVILVIAALILVGCFAFGGNDDGLILENVSVAGVNVGGMTKDAAVDAVNAATGETYTRMDMIVQAMGYEAVITPEISGAKLNTKKAVEKAYDFGHKGSAAQKAKDQLVASTTGYAVDLSDCLNLNADGIRKEIEALAGHFTSLLKQSTYEITGQTPDLSMDSDEEDGKVLVIQVGTPECSMDLDKVYQQVLDAYSDNVFTVEADYAYIQPDAIDLEAIYDEHYIAPVNATLDEDTYEAVDGSFGYGFDLTQAQTLLADAQPGETVRIAFSRIDPETGTGELEKLLFRDVLGKYTATSSDNNANRNENLRLACEAINGMILYPGDTFSYNHALGERTEEKGYKPGDSYAGGATVETIGGGICQVSSALYYCTLVADLDIVLRDFHGFATEYMPLGMDAVVSWGSLDFRFANSSNYPIKIDAKANGSSVTVQILGTDDKDYYVKMEYDVKHSDEYETTYQTMSADNPEGYRDGDVIVDGYTGYDVDVYKCKYSKSDDSLQSRDYVDSSNYRRRDAVVCVIKKTETPPTTPSTGTTQPGMAGSGGVSDGGGALPDE